jgi:hypothetical protein
MKRSHFLCILFAVLPVLALSACSGPTGPGEASGGSSSGGRSSGGGVSSGGGGVSTGGANTGGASVGGTNTGGTSVGGMTSGGTNSGGTVSDGGAGGSAAMGGAPSSGGVAAGGNSPSGGAGTGGGSTLADMYPCDGSTDGYDAVVTGSGSSWSVNGSGNHNSLLLAMRSALGSGGSGGTDKRTVLLVDDGTIPANEQLRISSNTLLNVCGTITVVDPTGGSDRSPIYARGATNIDIPHLTLRGNAQYGCFFRETEHVHIGVADIRLEGGLGMRIDNNPSGNSWGNSSNNAARVAGFQFDDVYVENVSMGVEFYGVEDIGIGKVVARDTSEAGLMLNNSVDAEIGLVDGERVSPNAGYAVFRMANDNGKDWDTGTHPMNIHVSKVIARDSGGSNGQGIFCLTDSGGVTIDEVDLEDTASNSIWLEWCTNVKIGSAATSSRIVDSGNLMISYGTETRMSNDIVLENIAITGTNIDFNQDCPPDIDWINVTRNGDVVSECE